MNFDLNQLSAEDTAEMVVITNDAPSNLVMVFAGPGHPKSIKLSSRVARENLILKRQQEQSQVNRKKWIGKNESVEDVTDYNLSIIIARTLDWFLVDDNGNRTDDIVEMDGKPFPFSEENARQLFGDPRMGTIFLQAVEFLGNEQSFTKGSVMISKPLQSKNSNSSKQKKA